MEFTGGEGVRKEWGADVEGLGGGKGPGMEREGRVEKG
jgi:hypothetical protein